MFGIRTERTRAIEAFRAVALDRGAGWLRSVLAAHAVGSFTRLATGTLLAIVAAERDGHGAAAGA